MHTPHLQGDRYAAVHSGCHGAYGPAKAHGVEAEDAPSQHVLVLSPQVALEHHAWVAAVGVDLAELLPHAEAVVVLAEALQAGMRLRYWQ